MTIIFRNRGAVAVPKPKLPSLLLKADPSPPSDPPSMKFIANNGIE